MANVLPLLVARIFATLVAWVERGGLVLVRAARAVPGLIVPGNAGAHQWAQSDVGSKAEQSELADDWEVERRRHGVNDVSSMARRARGAAMQIPDSGVGGGIQILV